MKLALAVAIAAAWLSTSAAGRGADLDAFRSRLSAALTKHLHLLLQPDGSVRALKGKTAEGQEALAFYLMFESTGEQKFRTAALNLADRVLKDMRATKFGVLAIKEKERGNDEKFMGGGPPAFGFYTANIAYILHREGGRADDLAYLATALDRFPWNEKGWWSQDIDVETGEPKVPMSKPSIINKSATMAMAAGMVGEFVRDIDPVLATRLKQKADKCIYEQIIPAQQADGYWHYSLLEKDPKGKDVLGYFMLTTHVLMNLQHFNAAYREPKLEAALRKAQAFALKNIAPMTDPNPGPANRERATQGTPHHYSLARETKRGFELGCILLGAGEDDEGIKIMDASIRHFPYGDAGQDGAHAAAPSALILTRP